ncbi:type VI secretion system tube protein TssD [Spongiimicrobium salis]|uniref:type VI secretion system tube protein TssD n=1 Tax=Spongiimicrobium salis TaxID=1667022 RepID=UPI00374D24CF
MSFLAKLYVDGQEYNVLSCTYNFEQPMDHTGKPSGKPLGGQIMITLESQGRYDLFHWMASPDQTKDGSIIFFKRDAMSRLQEVIFKKGFCVKLVENFDAVSAVPMQKRIVISAQTIQVGDMTFQNRWGQ